MDSPVVNTSSGEIPVPMEQSSGNPQIAPDNQLLIDDEQKMVGIEKPHHNDVLCGRGVTTNRHPGNESFRSLVGLNKVRNLYPLNLNAVFLFFYSIKSHYFLSREEFQHS